MGYILKPMKVSSKYDWTSVYANIANENPGGAHSAGIRKTDKNTTNFLSDDTTSFNVFGEGIDNTLGDASVSEPLSSKFDIEVSYDYYMPRKDILQINDKSQFRVEEGIPSDTPVAPLPNDDYVLIANMTLEPYVSNIKNIELKETSMRRYTMRDIGSLDKRLENTELTMSLTALEESSAAVKVYDEDGLDRFKSGVLVDDFKDHSKSNVDNQDYKVAIDSQNQECRPTYTVDNVRLIEQSPNSRVTNNYQITGDVITLPYSHEVVIANTIATTPENITPFTHIRKMAGMLQLFPSYDSWIDTETLPTVENMSEGSFNSIIAVANRLGVLGTVWNAWQESARSTASTSTNISTRNTVSVNSTALQPQNTELTRTSTTTTNTTSVTTTVNGIDNVSQVRTGTQTFAQERMDELGRITGTANLQWQPWARAKAIVLHGQNFLPNYEMFVTVDSYNLTSYVEPAFEITYSNKQGTFLSYKNSSIDQSLPEFRQYRNGKDYDFFDRGEVIVGLSSGASAICVADEINTLYLINVIGEFIENEFITGVISGASATYVSGVMPNIFKTTGAGSIYGVLNLPNDDNFKLPASVFTIFISDSINIDDVNTSGRAAYNAHGLTSQKQTTILSVRNANILSRQVSDTRVIQENWTRSSTSTSSASSTAVNATNCDCNCNCNCDSGGGGGDPLAQSFKHEDIPGIFVTKIDLYFSSVEQNSNSPVFVKICNMVNGFPGDKVPFSLVTKHPSEINFSETKLIPTTFTFESPIYLEGGVEYCFVVGADFDFTNNTKVWSGKMGEVSLDGQMIIKQPLMGSMFKSQNDSTWEPNQMSDICFTLYKAKFETDKIGALTLVNDTLNYSQMEVDPFEILTGAITAKIYHKNHGFQSLEMVKFVDSGNLDSSISTSFANSNNLVFAVNDVISLNEFEILIDASIAPSGYYGGNNLKILKNRKYDMLYLDGNDFVLPETFIDYKFTGKPWFTKEYPIQIKQNTAVPYPAAILSEINENLFSEGDKSFTVKAYLYSANPNLSPVIDLNTYSIKPISNNISNHIYVDPVIDTVGQEIVNDTWTISLSRNTGLLETTPSTVRTVLDPYFGREIYLNLTNNPEVNGRYTLAAGYILQPVPPISLNSQIDSVIINVFDPTIYDLYKNECNYVPTTMNLKYPASGFKLLFDYNVPHSSSITVFYKVSYSALYQDLNAMEWVKIENVSPYINTDNVNEFIEKRIDVEFADLKFDSVSIKLWFNTNDTTKVPRIKNFRLLAVV